MNRQVAEELLMKLTKVSREEVTDLFDAFFFLTGTSNQLLDTNDKKVDKHLENFMKKAIRERSEPETIIGYLEEINYNYTRMNEEALQYWFLFGIQIGCFLNQNKNTPQY